MSKIYNLEEYAFAKKIVSDVPEALKNIDKCINLLYDHQEYIDVARALQQLDESRVMLELILETYTQVLSKGAKRE